MIYIFKCNKFWKAQKVTRSASTMYKLEDNNSHPYKASYVDLETDVRMHMCMLGTVRLLHNIHTLICKFEINSNIMIKTSGEFNILVLIGVICVCFVIALIGEITFF